MSDQHEIIRQAYEAFRRQDAEGLIALAHPEIEFGGSAAAPDQVYRGHDGLRKYMSDIDGAFGREWDAQLERVADAGENQVVLIAKITGPGKGGLPLDLRVAHVWAIREGKLYRGRVYVPADDALRALGVEP